MLRDQSSFRFTAEPDPKKCASAFCRQRRAKNPTYTVKVGEREFLVCTSCARPWESVRGAKVEPIVRAVAGAGGGAASCS
jgi:hypothetical protein